MNDYELQIKAYEEKLADCLKRKSDLQAIEKEIRLKLAKLKSFKAQSDKLAAKAAEIK